MRKNNGFTLIELMITVVIISILLAVAVPSYMQYVMKSRRTEATSTLLEMASRQVRYYSENNTYATSTGVLGYGAADETTYHSEHQTYDIKVTAADEISFTLSAEPKNEQSSDKCGSLGYNSAGLKTVSVSNQTVAECW